MKQELQNKLFTSYPKIFRQKDLPMTKTCMGWGIDTLDGWYWLINNLCDIIQSHIDLNGKPQVEAAQVKEKWGTLSFYADGADNFISGMINLAEYLSGKICENCGSTDDVTCEGKEWVRTRCKTCRDKNKNI